MKIEINYRENIILEIYLNCYKNSMIIDLYDFFAKDLGSGWEPIASLNICFFFSLT